MRWNSAISSARSASPAWFSAGTGACRNLLVRPRASASSTCSGRRAARRACRRARSSSAARSAVVMPGAARRSSAPPRGLRASAGNARSARRSSARPASTASRRICRLPLTISARSSTLYRNTSSSSAASGSTSRGTREVDDEHRRMPALACTTRSSRPLPMIGSVLAVQVTTMSNSRRRSGSSFSVIASAPKRSASCLAALERAVGDRDRLRLARARNASPRARSSRRRRPAAGAGPRSTGKMRSASFTAAAAIEIDALPMSVCVRTSFATANVRWNSRFSTRPSEPAGFRRAHRLLHLAEDLRLAQHHRVEAAGDAERVRHRLARAAACTCTGRARRSGRPWNRSSQRATRRGIAAAEIDLGAVAGRQDRRFLHPCAAAGQVAQRVGQRVRRERDLLAHLERRGRVVEAERVERHGAGDCIKPSGRDGARR